MTAPQRNVDDPEAETPAAVGDQDDGAAPGDERRDEGMEEKKGTKKAKKKEEDVEATQVVYLQLTRRLTTLAARGRLSISAKAATPRPQCFTAGGRRDDTKQETTR